MLTCDQEREGREEFQSQQRLKNLQFCRHCHNGPVTILEQSLFVLVESKLVVNETSGSSFNGGSDTQRNVKEC